MLVSNFRPRTLPPLLYLSSVPDPVAVPDILAPYASLPGWPSLPLSLVTDSSPSEQLQLVIPVGVREDLAWVDIGTAITMITMFFYLLFTALRTAQRLAGNKPYAKTE